VLSESSKFEETRAMVRGGGTMEVVEERLSYLSEEGGEKRSALTIESLPEFIHNDCSTTQRIREY